MVSMQATSAYTYNNKVVWNILSNISNDITESVCVPVRKEHISVNYPQNISCNAIYSQGDIFMNVSSDAIKNIQKLDKIANLPDDWNENKAKPFSKELIDKCKRLISSLSIQPELFPTAANSIQLEYEKDNGEYLEFNIRENSVDVYQIYGDKHEEEFTIYSRVDEKVKETVDDFYARD